MPTYETTERFLRDVAALTPAQRAALKQAISEFVQDLRTGSFRKGLRVKGVQGTRGIFEMTWAGDGRATSEYGPERKPGEPHVIWRRCGTHDIFGRP